jgi:hypothetical protein
VIVRPASVESFAFVVLLVCCALALLSWIVGMVSAGCSGGGKRKVRLTVGSQRILPASRGLWSSSLFHLRATNDRLRKWAGGLDRVSKQSLAVGALLVCRRPFLVSVCRPSKQANNCDDFKHLLRSPANCVCIPSISAWLADWSEQQVGARYGDVSCRNHPLGGLPLA